MTDTRKDVMDMKAMLIDDKQQLVWSEVEKPVPKDDEILIEIYAAALNRADLLQRKGTYPIGLYSKIVSGNGTTGI